MTKGIRIPQATSKGYVECPENGIFDSSYQSSKTRRGRIQGGGNISPALTANGTDSQLIIIEKIINDMTQEEFDNLIFEYSANAMDAWDKGEESYNLFLDGLTMKFLRDAFAKRFHRPEGKGWVFEWETCRWFRIRKLTPRECFRLMDVNEDKIDDLMDTQLNKKGEMEQIISNSQLYKMAGNSIVVNPMYLTFKNIFFPTSVEQSNNEAEEGTQLLLF